MQVETKLSSWISDIVYIYKIMNIMIIIMIFVVARYLSFSPSFSLVVWRKIVVRNRIRPLFFHFLFSSFLFHFMIFRQQPRTQKRCDDDFVDFCFYTFYFSYLFECVYIDIWVYMCVYGLPFVLRLLWFLFIYFIFRAIELVKARQSYWWYFQVCSRFVLFYSLFFVFCFCFLHIIKTIYIYIYYIICMHTLIAAEFFIKYFQYHTRT